MARILSKSSVVAVVTMLLLLSSIFAGTVTAEAGAASAEDEPRVLQLVERFSDYICVSRHTRSMKFSENGSCAPNERVIQVSASLPFDYCYSRSTGAMSDDRSGDLCAGNQRYVEVDGSSSFFVCINRHSNQIHHINALEDCNTGTVGFFIDLRGTISKYACTEDNTNPVQCDYFPAGPHNEIREIGPMPHTGGGFGDIRWVWEFDGNVSPTQFCSTNCDNASIEAALEALPGIDDVAITGGPLAGTINAPVRIEFVGVQATTDIGPMISINNQMNTVNQDDITVVDGRAAGPEVSYVLPGGTVQIFEATGATAPNNPATYGPEVTVGPQPVDPMTGLYESELLMDGDYVVCADGPTAVSPSCEIVTVNGDVTAMNLVDVPGTISSSIVATGTNEVQSYDDFNGFGYVTGGTYTISFDGNTTAALQWDATAATIQTALEGLASIGAGNISVSGGPPGFDGSTHGPAVEITFINALGSANVPSITIDSSNLTGSGGCCGATYFVNPNSTDVEGSGAQHELRADRKVSGGTFTLTFNGSTTGPIAWNASAATVEAALNALPSINSTGSVAVSGQLVATTPIEEYVQHHMDIFFTDVPAATATSLLVGNSNLE